MEYQPHELDEIDLFFQSVQLDAQRDQREAVAFEDAWNQGLGDEVARASEQLSHDDTQAIFDILEHTNSLPQSVALFIVTQDAPRLSQSLQEKNPAIPHDFIDHWYGHASAAFLAAYPPLLETEEGEIFIDDELFSEVSFPTLSRYDLDTVEILQREIHSRLQSDPTGVEAVEYIAADPKLQEARNSNERHPDIAESVVRSGGQRYIQLMYRMLQEVDPRHHPGAEDREEMTADAVLAYKRVLVDGIWRDEIKPNMLRWHKDSISPQRIASAAALIENGQNPYSVIHAALEEEIAEFQRFYNEHVAVSFPREVLARGYVIPVRSLRQAQVDPDGIQSGANYANIMRQDMGIVNPRGAIAAGIQERVTQQASLVRHMDSLLTQDSSGFAALDFFMEDKAYKDLRARGASYPATNEDILAMGAARYKQWYLQLAEHGSVPYPQAR